MQAVAAEFSGCAEKFYCFLERRVLISQELENSGVRSQNSILLKNPLWPDWPWRGVACGSQRRLGRLQALQTAPLQAFRQRMVFQQNQNSASDGR